MKRIYIDVSGGMVQSVDLRQTPDVAAIVLDWDNIAADPQSFWDAEDMETREYIKTNFPNHYKKYFAGLENQ